MSESTRQFRFTLRRYINRSICACGETVLREDVPLGKIYDCDEGHIESATYVCGGCDTPMRIQTINVKDDSGSYRPLPLDLFGPPEAIQ